MESINALIGTIIKEMKIEYIMKIIVDVNNVYANGYRLPNLEFQTDALFSFSCLMSSHLRAECDVVVELFSSINTVF